MGSFQLPKEDLPFLTVALVGALRFSLQEHKRRGITADERAALYDQISDQILEMGFATKGGTPRVKLSEIPSASPLQRRIAAVIDQVFDEVFAP